MTLGRISSLAISILSAAVLWFLMFSKWTSGVVNFWLEMTVSAVILTSLGLMFTSQQEIRIRKPLLQLATGIVIAVALWGIFWVGDFLSSMMFDFARPQVNDVYSMKTGLPDWGIALLLLLVIGPAEEFFWRGYIQQTFLSLLKQHKFKYAEDHAFLFTTLIYALVHIWSFNFMLVMAALVAGSVWGFIYRIKPDLLPALILSHAIWDALVFVIMPI